MTRQQLLIMETDDSDLRSHASGWSAEDGCTVVPRVGASPGPRWHYSYDCPLFAIGDGWRLMAPPTAYIEKQFRGPKDDVVEVERWEWWFERIVEVAP
jgi:hypothetical protein